MSKTNDDPWYAQAGLRFKCSQCGDCCTGAPGFVWVNKEEIAKLAEAAGIDDIEEFMEMAGRMADHWQGTVSYQLDSPLPSSLVQFEAVFEDGPRRADSRSTAVLRDTLAFLGVNVSAARAECAYRHADSFERKHSLPAHDAFCDTRVPESFRREFADKVNEGARRLGYNSSLNCLARV